MTKRVLPALLLVAFLGACHGTIADPSSDGEPGSEGGPGGGAGSGGGGGVSGDGSGSSWREAGDTPSCEVADASHTSVRLLTRTEYNNTLADLLGDTTSPLEASPSAEHGGFDNEAVGVSISPRLMEEYASIAGEIAERAIARRSAVPSLACSAPGDARGCATEVVREFGMRAYRRPLSTDEEAALLALYDMGAADGGLDAGLRTVVEAVLQSPDFLYHVEAGGEPLDGASIAPLTGFEVASRLSYFLWNTMPDDRLFDAAASGELATREGVAAQAERMLADPRARGAIRNMHEQWLELDLVEAAMKDAAMFPEWSPELAHDLREETLAFLDELVLSGGSVDEIFLSPFTMMNDRVASFYGVTPPGSGDTFVRVPLDERRAGVLTHASLLAGNAKTRRTSPVHRGAFVRQRILCQTLPSPPPGIPMLPDETAGDTERERLARHREDPACAGCHQLMDPIGFAFETYDAAGRWTDVGPDGSPVDATGELVSTRDADGPLDGAVELSARLAGSQEVRECVTEQWFRYALGRRPTEADACSVHEVLERGEATEFRLRDMLIAITQTDAFRQRRVPETGGECR